jgi:CHAT domain-containing protein
MKRAFLYIFIFPVFVFFATTVPALALPENEPLKLNEPVTRELKTGERHFFVVDARENQMIEIACDQQGVDLELAALAPNGEKISSSSAPLGFTGREALVFVAPQSGAYRIEVGSGRTGNIAGSYTILWKAARPAGADEISRAEAYALAGAARELLSGAENRLEKASLAIEKLEKARALCARSGDAAGEANALFQLGYIYGNEFGEKTKAIEALEKSLALYEKLADEAGQALALTYLADEMRDYDRADQDRRSFIDKSHAFFKEAVALHRKRGDKPDEAAALSFWCRLYNDTGDFQKGFETCREALRLVGNGDPLIDYRIYTNLASLSSNSGDLENALKYNRTALERIALAKDQLNPIRYAFVKSNVGGIYLTQKKYVEAETELREALTITEQIKRPTYSAYILVRLSFIGYETNRYDDALKAATQALEIYRRFDPVKRQAALNALGKASAALGQTDAAREMFAEAVEVNRKNNDRYAEADSLYNLARLETEAGNYEIARPSIEQAINHSEMARSQLLGKKVRSSYLSILKKYYELEIDLLVRLYEKTRKNEFLEAAWQRHEKIRARSLLENFIESGLNVAEVVPEDFFAREQTLLEAIAAAEMQRAEAVKLKDGARQREAEARLQRNLDRYQVLQEEGRRKNPQFSAINQPRSFGFADAQQLLDEETAIVEFALGEKQSYVWVICKNSVKFAVLPARGQINRTAREFYAALADREAPDAKTSLEKSRGLSRLILAPVAAELKNLKRLVVIDDGALQLIPFSALTLAPDAESQPLAADFEVVKTPSFSSLFFLHENKTSRPKSEDVRLAVFADPIFQEDDERFSVDKIVKPKTGPKISTEMASLEKVLRDFGIDRLSRLPFSGIEAREIEKLAPDRTVLALGADASRQKFLRGDFNSYRVLHFATHGFLNQNNPELSGLVLSLYDEKRNAQNGFLRVIDLYSLRLGADLVVLSACQTGLGKEVDGEGIVGLTRGFMYAGASSVVSSLWKVEDAATAEFMKYFYRAMLKENQTPSAALRTAQNELRAIPRFSNPRHWSGFMLNGAWR